MRTRIIIYIVATILLIACVLGIWAAGSQSQASSLDSVSGEGQIPELSELLNISGDHSFSYVNALGQRIAAIDEIGNRYFYVYDSQDRVGIIVDQNGLVIWQAVNQSDKATK
jgi:YD repeat-containing protein